MVATTRSGVNSVISMPISLASSPHIVPDDRQHAAGSRGRAARSARMAAADDGGSAVMTGAFRTAVVRLLRRVRGLSDRPTLDSGAVGPDD